MIKKAIWDLDTVLRCIVSRGMTAFPHGETGLIAGFCMAKALKAFEEIKEGVERAIGSKCIHEYFVSNRDISYLYFRHHLIDNYKATRKKDFSPTTADKVYFDYLNENIDEFVGTKCKRNISGIELDDAISIYADDGTDNNIIVSSDKDFSFFYDTVNSITQQYKAKDPKQMYYLMLLGDAADNIKGVKGMGAVKSKALVDSLPLDELGLAVKELYEKEGMNYNLTLDLLCPLRKEQFYYDKATKTTTLNLRTDTLTIMSNGQLFRIDA